MKKVTILIMVLFLLSGCKSKNDIKINTNTNIFGTWINKFETEKIYFGEDFHFSYYGNEGNPIDDYDLCESYSIDNNIIILNCDNSKINDTFIINNIKDDFLILEINKECIIFNRYEEK